MDILEQYKRKAEKLRQDQEQSSHTDSNVQAIRSVYVLSSMDKIHTYLHDLIEQLNFIKPDIQTNMSLNHYGQFENLRQQDYKLVLESDDKKEIINLTFALRGDEKIEHEVESVANEEKLLEKIKKAGIMTSLTRNQPSKIIIEPYIPARIIFSTDFPATDIHIEINNFKRPGKSYYLLIPDQVTEEFLDELGKYILREENRLTEMLTEDSQSISMAEKPASQLKSADTPQTEEMEISRLRSLFNREQRIYLTYHNTIKDVSSRSNGIILGRAKDCEITIATDLASRHHAQVVFRKGKFLLVDQSSNGSFVKPQGGKEVYVQSEEVPLSGSGFISLGKSITVDNEHLIYYSCQ